MKTVGFIGVGNMGGPMARNLLKAGIKLKAFDPAESALAAVVKAGAERVGAPADAAKGVDAVVTMLPAGPHVSDVYGGKGGVLAAVSPGTLLIDSSTIDVETARATTAKARERGLEMLDAPVSGGVGGAEAGTLTFMVGGSAEAFRKGEPLLQKMGKNIIHAGGPGNGQAAKICNNMILGISMVAVSEGFALAERLGLDAQTLFNISSKSSGQCWSMTTYCPVPGPVPTSPANRGYQPGFTAAMMAKDMKLALQASQANGATAPLCGVAASLYDLLCKSGQSGLDFSSIVLMLTGKSFPKQ